MEKEKLTKQIATVFTEIIKKLVNPTFSFPKGGAATRTLTTFVARIEKEFGAVTCERLVDACITGAYTFRERDNWTIKQVFGPSTIQRVKEQKRGQLFYQNQWLETGGLSRGGLLDLIKDRSEHPLAKYIYMRSEEATKQRQLNQKTGFLICQVSTLGWSPLSKSCQQCEFQKDCMTETERKNPELYRLRIEYGNAAK